MNTPNLAYVSGTGYSGFPEDMSPVSAPVLSAPFENVNANYVLEQDFICLVNAIDELPLNTKHPDYGFPFYYLTREGPRRDLGGGMCRWTRTYRQVPPSRSEASSIIYNLIGYTSFGGGTTIVGREQQNVSLPARIQYDYFLLDQDSGNIYDSTGAAVFTGTPGVLPSTVNIPTLPAQEYFDSVPGAVKFGLQSTVIGYGPDATTPQVNYPVPDTTNLQPPYDAYPTREKYEKWRDQTETVHTYDPETNVLTDTGLYEIVAMASQCRVWEGLMVERQTVYIRPQ